MQLSVTRVLIPSPTPKSSFLMTCFDPRAFSPFPIFLRTHQTLSTPSPCFLLGVLFGVTLTVLGNFQNSEQMPTRRAKLERAAGIMEQRLILRVGEETRPSWFNRSSNLGGESSLQVSNIRHFYPACGRRQAGMSP